MKAFSRLLGKSQQPPAAGLAPSTETTVTVTATPTRATRSSTATNTEGSTLSTGAALAPDADHSTATTTNTTSTITSTLSTIASSKKRPFADVTDASPSSASPSFLTRRIKLKSSETLRRSPSSSLSSTDQTPESSRSTSEAPTTPPSDSNCQPSLACGPGTSLLSESLVRPAVIATSPSPPPSSPDSSRLACDSSVAIPGAAGQAPKAPALSEFADRNHPLHKKFTDDSYLAQLPDLDAEIEFTASSMMDAMHFGGSKPISMVNNPHRDPTAVRFRESLTGSLHAGGNSISLSRTPFLGNSWVRDNILPTSFTQHQSPSNHSSSYQPKLEANYLSNFLCCGKEIRNLHDLLKHYEDTHANGPPNGVAQFGGLQPHQPRPRPSGLAPSDHHFSGQSHLSPNHGMYPFSTVQQQQQRSMSQMPRDQRHLAMTANMDDMETMGDIDMDEAVGHMELDDGMAAQKRRQLFSQQQHRPLMQNNGPSGLSQALRPAQPTTPPIQNFGLSHDPTVSSANTPALTAQAQQQPHLDQTFMQDTTTSGAFSGIGLGAGFNNGMANFGNLNFAAALNNNNNSSDFCINDPAKALFSPGNPHPAGNGNIFGDTPAARNLQHQLMQSMNLSVHGLQTHPEKALLQQLGPMMLRDEDKPHRCPVVGCDKAYKNSNGLKYHKSHGHLNQQLHDNGDGTFSIINPETSTPYPGTEGMEKEKPFSCEMCNKRYKNPNGLKYHRLHSDCNPDLRLKKLQELQAAGLPTMNLFQDGLVDGMPNGMSGLDSGLGGLGGGLASGLHTPLTEQMEDMDMSDLIAG